MKIVGYSRVINIKHQDREGRVVCRNSALWILMNII